MNKYVSVNKGIDLFCLELNECTFIVLNLIKSISVPKKKMSITLFKTYNVSNDIP